MDFALTAISSAPGL